MNIVFLTRRFFPQIGGVEKHVLEISKVITQLNHNVTVITEQPQGMEKSIYQSKLTSAISVGNTNKIRILRIDAEKENWFKKFRVWSELFKYLHVIWSADVIHCHDVFFWYFPFRFLFPFKKVYTTFHGYEGNSLPTEKAILMHKISERLSDGNICVGDFLKKWYGTKPDYVIYGAVDKNIFKKNHQLKMNKRIIFIGRLEKETGVMEYIKALKILQDKGKTFVLDIYGKGSLEDEIRRYSSKNKLKLNLKGFVNNIEAIIPNYEYVFCSRYLGILEALAFKKNIFAEYNNEVKKDYLEMAPFADFVSISKNAEEISKSLENVVTGKNKLDYDKGYKWVKNKTWEDLVNIYFTLWKSK